MSFKTCDFLVVGAGVIGISVARELVSRYPDAKIIVIDKELSEAEHASGRNSGVLHAGFYYTEDSLKAKFTRDGNLALTEYCDQNNLPIRKCGKLVVAKTEHEVTVLDTLMERAVKNNVKLEKITEEDAREIEPKVKTKGFALYSPTTSSVDPKSVVKQMKRDAIASGVEFHFGVSYIRQKLGRVETNNGFFSVQYLVNCAGLYADKIAQDYGFSENYYVLPFKGLYLYANHSKSSLSTHIYPVPNLDNPFLGVHFTASVDGAIKVGPTAIPAFWREQYNGFDNFTFSEFGELVYHQLALVAKSGFGFNRLAYNEIKKYYKPNMIQQASELARGFDRESFKNWAQPGIRAQLVNRKNHKLVMDFLIEGDDRSMHILNAVSPAFTCSIPFSKFVVDRIASNLRG